MDSQRAREVAIQQVVFGGEIPLLAMSHFREDLEISGLLLASSFRLVSHSTPGVRKGSMVLSKYNSLTFIVPRPTQHRA